MPSFLNFSCLINILNSVINVPVSNNNAHSLFSTLIIIDIAYIIIEIKIWKHKKLNLLPALSDKTMCESLCLHRNKMPVYQ